MTALHISTALLHHPQLSAALNKQVLLKMENTQPAGSFKSRGIGLLCQRAMARGARHLVCASGGNAGFAAAHAGAVLQLKTTVVVPQTTLSSVCERIRTLQANVIVHGEDWDDAHAYALFLCEESGSVYIPPFDHPDIWEGNGTMIDEAVFQMRQLGSDFDVVICAVGGGGLMNGVLTGLHRNGLAEIPVIAVETEGAASLHEAISANQVVTLPAIRSIASSLGAKRVAEQSLAWTRSHPVQSVVVSDKQAISAVLAFADDMRTLVEPACGAALSVAYENLPVLAPYQRPLIIVCGGIGASVAALDAWKQQG